VTEHPEIMLAEYVDGALSPDARAEVEAHLAGCDRCREEVALAEEARSALAGLPEVPAPEGLTFAVRRRARRPPSPRIGRWVAATAAAAALVAGGFVVVRAFRTPGEGGPAPGAGGVAEQAPSVRDAGEQPEAAGGGALAADGRPVPTFSVSNQDYDQGDLVTLGRRFRDDARSAIQAGLAPTAREFFEDFDVAAFTPRVRGAIDCSLRQVPPEQLLVPFSIEAASFQGQPAYVAAFLQGPTPDLEYDRVVIWVVARDSCSLRSLASQRL
jgi:hypothetical protein